MHTDDHDDSFAAGGHGPGGIVDAGAISTAAPAATAAWSRLTC